MFRNNEKLYIFNISKIIKYVYGIICFFIVILVYCFIYAYKNVINSFFNFVGIFPTKFISDDEYFYNAIVNNKRFLLKIYLYIH